MTIRARVRNTCAPKMFLFRSAVVTKAIKNILENEAELKRGQITRQLKQEFE